MAHRTRPHRPQSAHHGPRAPRRFRRAGSRSYPRHLVRVRKRRDDKHRPIHRHHQNHRGAIAGLWQQRPADLSTAPHRTARRLTPRWGHPDVVAHSAAELPSGRRDGLLHLASRRFTDSRLTVASASSGRPIPPWQPRSMPHPCSGSSSPSSRLPSGAHSPHLHPRHSSLPSEELSARLRLRSGPETSAGWAQNSLRSAAPVQESMLSSSPAGSSPPTVTRSRGRTRSRWPAPTPAPRRSSTRRPTRRPPRLRRRAAMARAPAPSSPAAR